MSFTLRKYQTEAVRTGIGFFRMEKPKPSIMVLPTAAGKSIVIAEILRNTPGKVLVLQPSKELLTQNFEKYVVNGGTAAIYSASMGQKQWHHVTFITIGSVKNMADVVKFRGIKCLIIDEVHLYPKGQGSMMMDFILASGITHVLGLTATPIKLHSFGSKEDPYSKLVMLTSYTFSTGGSYFKEIIHVTQVKEMVEGGYWSPLIYENHHIDKSRLQFNSTRAEYTEASLELVYQYNRLEDKIIQRIAAMPERKSILVAVPSVSKAIAMAKKIPGAAAVYSDMDPAERTRVIKEFKAMKIRVVINVNILSTGFDHPQLDALICGRETASFAWFYQFLGRGTRIHPSKKNCLFVDFSCNTERFGRIEDLSLVKEGFTWKLYGQDGRLLTGIRIDEIGEHTAESEAKKRKEKGQRNLVNFRVPRPGEPIVFPFGKFKDVKVSLTPKWYIDWWKANMVRSRATQHVFDEIDRLEKNHLVVSK